jgi:hypothetical protein
MEKIAQKQPKDRTFNCYPILTITIGKMLKTFINLLDPRVGSVPPDENPMVRSEHTIR